MPTRSAAGTWCSIPTARCSIAGTTSTSILDSPLQRFILSLDGLSKETFELIREKAKWDEVYPAVEELCRRAPARAARSIPIIIAQFSVMKQNAHEVDAYRAFWEERGAEVKVRPMLEWTATGTVRTDTIVHDTDSASPAPGATTPWRSIRTARWSPARSTTRASSRSATSTRSPSRRRGGAWASGCGAPHREHRWKDIPDLCKGCGDWQVAGAEYEEETRRGHAALLVLRPGASAARPADGRRESADARMNQIASNDRPRRGAIRAAAGGIGIPDDAGAVVRLSLQRALPALPLHQFQYPQGISRRALHAGGDVQEDRRRIRAATAPICAFPAAASRCCIRRPPSCWSMPRRSAARSA